MTSCSVLTGFAVLAVVRLRTSSWFVTMGCLVSSFLFIPILCLFRVALAGSNAGMVKLKIQWNTGYLDRPFDFSLIL